MGLVRQEAMYDDHVCHVYLSELCVDTRAVFNLPYRNQTHMHTCKLIPTLVSLQAHSCMYVCM
jgi:hypothetical protein